MDSSLFFFLLLSTIRALFPLICNRYPFGLLVKFKLWNLAIFNIPIVFQRLSGKSPTLVCFFCCKEVDPHWPRNRARPRAVGKYETCPILLAILWTSERDLVQHQCFAIYSPEGQICQKDTNPRIKRTRRNISACKPPIPLWRVLYKEVSSSRAGKNLSENA